MRTGQFGDLLKIEMKIFSEEFSKFGGRGEKRRIEGLSGEKRRERCNEGGFEERKEYREMHQLVLGVKSNAH